MFRSYLITVLLLLFFATASAELCLSTQTVTSSTDFQLPVISSYYDACNIEIQWQVWFTRLSNADYGTSLNFGMSPNYFSNYYEAYGMEPGEYHYTGYATATTRYNHRIFIDKVMSDDGGDFEDLKLTVIYSAGTPK